MENHNFSWEHPLFLWPFSVALPEGILRVSNLTMFFGMNIHQCHGDLAANLAIIMDITWEYNRDLVGGFNPSEKY